MASWRYNYIKIYRISHYKCSLLYFNPYLHKNKKVKASDFQCFLHYRFLLGLKKNKNRKNKSRFFDPYLSLTTKNPHPTPSAWPLPVTPILSAGCFFSAPQEGAYSGEVEAVGSLASDSTLVLTSCPILFRFRRGARTALRVRLGVWELSISGSAGSSSGGLGQQLLLRGAPESPQGPLVSPGVEGECGDGGPCTAEENRSPYGVPDQRGVRDPGELGLVSLEFGGDEDVRDPEALGWGFSSGVGTPEGIHWPVHSFRSFYLVSASCEECLGERGHPASRSSLSRKDRH